jgi:hypothetical protein
MSIIQEPILTELNNGILSGHFAMPMKDITSDNNATFSLNRRRYFRTYIPKHNFKIPEQATNSIQRQSLGLSNNMVSIEGTKTYQQKKWIGGCRDASQIIANRRIHTTGAILSNEGPTSFKNISDNNTAREALNRCRSQGYCVPRKVTKNTTVF